jgi:hypothetical protein
VLLHAFAKKTPRTPRGEIATALRSDVHLPRVETLRQLAEILDVEFAITPGVPLTVRPRRRPAPRRQTAPAVSG